MSYRLCWLLGSKQSAKPVYIHLSLYIQQWYVWYRLCWLLASRIL